MTRRTLATAIVLACLASRGLAAPSDEAAIRAARARSNAAIAAHDLGKVAAEWSSDYVGIASTNVRTVGREAQREKFAEYFATRPDLVWERTPTLVTINAGWGQAGEQGTWTGHWSSKDGVTRVGGIYFAKWRHEGDAWRILAETFVQTACSGTPYCDAPPQ